MRDWYARFLPAKTSGASIVRDTELNSAKPAPSRFEVLVRHLLSRFIDNDLTRSDDDTKQLVQISLMLALPGLLLALFLVPAYHGFPPYPPQRGLWDQVGDHYFYVMYAFVAMAIVAVLEWELFFPDLLDIFVLSTLPIPEREVFTAKVLAIVIFLASVTVGTNILGLIFLPPLTASGNPGMQFLAHASAVFAAGAFAAAGFLAMQGFLLAVLGARIMDKAAPILQASSIIFLLVILVLFPTIAKAAGPIFTSSSQGVRLFPPFWFLGIYETVLHGADTPPVFHDLAKVGWWALGLSFVAVLATYPVAYQRQVKQTTEGGLANQSRQSKRGWLQPLLHRLLLRKPRQRAIFHFIGQTILRTRRQRVMVAIYAGLALALALGRVVSLNTVHGSASLTLKPEEIVAAALILSFWSLAGLTSVLAGPLDRRAAWMFYVISGRAQPDHLDGSRIFVTVVSLAFGLAGLLGLSFAARPSSPVQLALEAFAIIPLIVVLGELFLHQTRFIPFTHRRRSAVQDLPLAFVRYFVAYPLFISLAAFFVKRGEHSLLALIKLLASLAMTQWLLIRNRKRAISSENLDFLPDETEDYPKQLGLRGD